DVFSDRDLVTMATRTAAEILRWDHLLGSLEAGKRADLIVIAGNDADPYAQLLTARETAIRLVVINGVPRYGEVELMQRFGPGTAPAASAALIPLSQQLKPVALDALTVVDDPDFLARLSGEPNLPGYLKDALPGLF